jgi:hypothetical protein
MYHRRRYGLPESARKREAKTSYRDRCDYLDRLIEPEKARAKGLADQDHHKQGDDHSDLDKPLAPAFCKLARRALPD